jgi:hypothetical protein
MHRLGRSIQLVGVHAVPVVGVFWGDWSDATAVAFYWCETAIVVFFVALRLVLHRRATNKRGHYVETKTSIDGGPWKKGVTTYNKSFLTTAIAFGVGNLIFLAVLLGLFASRLGGGEVDLDELKRGVAIAALIVAGGFAIDLAGLRERTFASLRLQAEAALWRVFVIYLAIFIGVFCAVVLDLPRALFVTFIGLRVFTDVASMFKQYDPERPPWWVSRFVKDRAAFEDEWRTEREARLRGQEEDEQPFLGRPSRSPGVAVSRKD